MHVHNITVILERSSLTRVGFRLQCQHQRWFTETQGKKSAGEGGISLQAMQFLALLVQQSVKMRKTSLKYNVFLEQEDSSRISTVKLKLWNCWNTENTPAFVPRGAVAQHLSVQVQYPGKRGKSRKALRHVSNITAARPNQAPHTAALGVNLQLYLRSGGLRRGNTAECPRYVDGLPEQFLSI